MFRRSVKALAVAPFRQFLTESRGKHKGLPRKRYIQVLTSLYRALGPKELAALEARAKMTPYKPIELMKKKKKKKPTRKLWPYVIFVKANLSKVGPGLPKEKMKRVAALWRRQKG